MEETHMKWRKASRPERLKLKVSESPHDFLNIGMHEHMHIYVHVHTYVCVYEYMYMCIKTKEYWSKLKYYVYWVVWFIDGGGNFV